VEQWRQALDETQTEIPTEPAPASEKGISLGSFLIDLLETLVLSVLLFVGINAVTARIRVDGFSMEPTLETGEFVVVNKLAYRLGEPARGDIVVFRYPYDPQQEYIKRIIGLPGDTIEIGNGVVSVNGQAIEEPYIAAAPAYQANLTVPEGSVFVLGDNRNNSSDSHNWGAVPLEYLVGKALVIYWPPTQWGLVPHASTASAAP
jgi:signal peptidase I